MKILITTSTLPISDDDKVPAFVKDQSLELKKAYPHTKITIHAPHNHQSKTTHKRAQNKYYKEVRFHYFWPFRWELLAGHAIMPALKKNILLYFQIPFLFIFQAISLIRLTLKEKPDLIYAHWFTPQAINTALVSKLTRTPFVFTTHASDVSVLHNVPFSKTLVSWVCKRASAYTAVSERTAKKLESFFDKETWKNEYKNKLSVIPMGISLDIPIINSSDIKKTKKQFNIPEDKKYILYLGRLAEKKGVKYLLNAFSDLPTALSKDVCLIIAGDGQLKDSLIKLALELELKNVYFTGYVHGKTKDTLLSLSDFTCFPSIIDSSGDSEGFPVVIMESLAAGKIVLTSDVSGGESIIKSGHSGYIFKQKNANEIKNTLVKAMNLPESKKTAMKANSKKLAGQFNWSLIIKKHYEIFERALK